MTRVPAIEVEPSGRTWRWRIRHPRTGMTLLTGTCPTRSRALRAAAAHADRWTRRYGHRIPTPTPVPPPDPGRP